MKIYPLVLTVLLLLGWVVYEHNQLIKRQQPQNTASPHNPTRRPKRKPRTTYNTATQTMDKGLLTNVSNPDIQALPAPTWSNIDKEASKPKKEIILPESDSPIAPQKDNPLIIP